MQARYYDPALGRFLSNDPVGFTPARPDLFNRYAYAANDPVNMVDPDGEHPIIRKLIEEVVKRITPAVRPRPGPGHNNPPRDLPVPVPPPRDPSVDPAGQYSGKVIPSGQAPSSDEIDLAESIGGQPSQKFESDPYGREFDAVSEAVIAQTTRSLSENPGQSWRSQIRETHRAARATGRNLVIEFRGGVPSSEQIRHIQRYSKRYNTNTEIRVRE